MRLPAREVADKYQECVFRAAFSICRNQEDAEDIVQETFLRYIEGNCEYENEQHIKAWLIRTAVNRSKNVVQSFWHRKREAFGDYMQEIPFQEPADRELVETVLSLPEKYRIILYLYYYEDYPVSEISEILHLSANSVKSRLYRGRQLLKTKLGEEWTDDE